MGNRPEDIAQELSLSIAAVSRALHESTEHLVKEESRQRILDFVEKTGYKPNIKSRGLTKEKLTNLFLILSQDEASIFYNYYFIEIEIMRGRGKKSPPLQIDKKILTKPFVTKGEYC